MPPASNSPAAKEPAKHLYLVDGSGYIFRAFFAIQRGGKPMTRPDGTPTGAVFGFTSMLLRLIDKALDDKAVDYLAVIFDAAEKTFRNAIYPEYKAHRPDAPEELVPQFPMVRDATRAMGLPSIELDQYEADDIIASYAFTAAKQGIAVTIVSSDKDLMQLVGAGADGVKICMYDPMKDRDIGPAEVMEKFGVGPEKVVEVQALVGDSVDNVPGVKGIGGDPAARIIRRYDTIEKVFQKTKNKDGWKSEVAKDSAKVEAQIYKIAGEKFSIGSQKQLGKILFEKLELPGGKRNDKGEYVANTEVIQELAAKGQQICELILEFRFLNRLEGSLIDLISEQEESARISRRLVELKTDVPLPMPIEQMALKQPDPERLRPFLVENNFKSILARLGMAPASSDEIAAAPAVSAPPAETAAPAAKAEPAAPKAAPGDPPKIDRAAYALVQDETALQAWIARAGERGIVAFDTETTSLDAMRAELVGFSLALGPNEACYVPVAHVAGGAQGALALEAPRTDGAIKQIKRERAIALLKPLLEDDTVLKIGHNIKYDAQVLAGYGVSIAPHDDTMLMSFVLDAGKNGHGMDELSERHLKHTPITYEQVCGTGKAQIGFAEVPLERARDYAAEDADVTWRFHTAFRPRLVGEHLVTVYETLERPLVPILAAMERAGIAVDPAALKTLSEDFAKRMGELEGDIHKSAGTPFNVGSPKQLGEILFEKLQLEGGKKGKTGAYGTDSSVLEGLAPLHPLPRLVLDWRQLQKLKSTYADALVLQINPTTKRVHTSYSMTGAQTGRLSSTDPNLQNIPVRTEEGRKIRRAFVAAKGMTLISLDYSQIELRLLAHVADMEVLKKAFREGVDIHALTASQVFGVPLKGMDPNLRRRAKTINFGIIYGMSSFGLANQLGISKQEAGAYIEAYFERYPGIRAYMERTKDFAKRNGFVVTPFGRRIHITGFAGQRPGERSFAERQSINAPLQGGAADIIKRAMIRIPVVLARKKLKARMLLQVHDELLFEAPAAEVDATVAALKPVMEKAALPALDLSVPLVVDAGTGANWAEAH